MLLSKEVIKMTFDFVTDLRLTKYVVDHIIRASDFTSHMKLLIDNIIEKAITD